jgi:hypothetical protein
VPRFDDIPDPSAALLRRELPPVPELAPSPTRAARRATARWLTVASVLWIAGLLARLGLRPDLAAAGPELVGWIAAGALAFGLAQRRGRVPASVRLVQLALALVVGAFLVLAVAFSGPSDGGGLQGGGCMAAASLLSAGPLVFVALFFRRSFATAPAWRGAFLGALAGLAGAVGVHAHCPVAVMSHVVLAHGLPILLGALVGAVAGAAFGRT